MGGRRFSPTVLASLLLGGVTAQLLLDARYELGLGSGLALLAVYGYEYFDVREYLIQRRGRGFAGLRMVVPVAPLDPGHKQKQETGQARVATGVAAMCAALDGVRAVDLMLCSGFRMIGWQDDKGWLYDALTEDPAQTVLRVLLLDPESAPAQARGERIMKPKYDAGHYCEGTRAVLSTLRHWEQTLGMRIEVRLYQEEPIWQMVVLPTEVWLMSAAHHGPTDLSPMYVFKRHEPYGLAWGLEAVWDRRWTRTDNRAVTLKDQPDPDPAKVKKVSLF